MEIALQGESKGIFYEGYEKTFIQCIFEEGEVQGRNERYEFRCDSHLECCGRICCTPQDAVIPLWLMIIFIIMALLLLLALLGLIAYLCAKRRQKPKKPKFVPSPMTEEQLSAPRATKVIQHSATEIGRLLHSEETETSPAEPLRAQLAFHRPFVPDPMEETDFAAPLRHSASFHSISEISQSQPVSYSTVERPKGKQADVMFTRPGFDNVPSY